MKHFIDIKSEVTLYKTPRKTPDDPLFAVTMIYKSTEKTVHKERLVYDKSLNLVAFYHFFLVFHFSVSLVISLNSLQKKNMANLTCKKPPSSAIGDDTHITMEN